MVDRLAAAGVELRRAAAGRGIDAFWGVKQSSQNAQGPAPRPSEAALEAIPPKRSAVGVVLAFFAVVMGFALIWHIWWMAIAG
jgi:cytochrome o ubiquinol oxidase subunit 1